MIGFRKDGRAVECTGLEIDIYLFMTLFYYEK